MNAWRTCSSCKKEISLNNKYYECSVSTCTGRRTGYVFCTVSCWESHLPGARHRDAAAIEMFSPKVKESADDPTKAVDAVDRPKRRLIVNPQSAVKTALPSNKAGPKDILIVVSKMKLYISEISGMNTSGQVAEVLSEKVRRICDQAIDEARRQGRKTVLDRDFR